LGSITWGPEIAEVYDQAYAAQSAAPVLGPMVDLLTGLARGGPVLELAAGTGRVALPLAARGLAVAGIELSPHMAERMAAKPGAGAVPVTIGDMTSTRVPGTFRLVYLVANTIMNVTTQDDQLAVFANAAAHLQPGGRFVVEVEARSAPGSARRGRVGVHSQPRSCRDRDLRRHRGPDRVVTPLDRSDGHLVRHATPYRYVWLSELDLMAKLTGFRVRDRWAGWDRAPFTSASTSQVAVFEKLPQPTPVEAPDLRG
jgi:SAM-dependent methyltransferase